MVAEVAASAALAAEGERFLLLLLRFVVCVFVCFFFLGKFCVPFLLGILFWVNFWLNFVWK